jgi:hypothetical protein
VSSASETQSRYEALRRHALEPQSPTSRDDLERGFIERQGLAAWLTRESASLTESSVSGNARPAASAGVPPPDRDLIGVLTDLILGDRKEPNDDRRA